MARTRALWNFFRLNAAFANLPNEALAKLVTGLEEVAVPAGTEVVSEGDPPGPMFVVEEGRLRAFHTVDGVERDLAFLRDGDVFGERSLFLGEPRAATVEAIRDCRLLRLPTHLYQELVDENPEFRARMQVRVAQYSYRDVARVPLDFADEILPAEAVAADRQSAPEAARAASRRSSRSSRPSRTAAGRSPGGASRTSSRSTRWTAAPRASRWSAATTAVPFRSPTSARSPTRRRAGRRSTGSRGPPRISASTPARSGPRRAGSTRCRCRRSSTGRATTGSCSTGSSKNHVRVADPESGLRRYKREEFLEGWTGYASVIAYGEGLEQQPAQKLSLGWIKPFLRPYLKLLVIATFLACARRRPRARAPDPHRADRRQRARQGDDAQGGQALGR